MRLGELGRIWARITLREKSKGRFAEIIGFILPLLKKR